MTPPRLSLPDLLPEGWERFFDAIDGHALAATFVSDQGAEVAAVYADPWHGEVEMTVHGPLDPAVAAVLAGRLAEAARLALGQPAPVEAGATS